MCTQRWRILQQMNETWLKKDATEKYSTYNDEKSAVAETFFIILKNKIYKCMTSISKNVYINKLGELINTTIHIIEQLK